jgi:peptidoglycan/xylan/chitin deacetylase (PgdA/CDA1 family)
MAENKGQTRGIRISDRLLIVLAVLIGITLLAAVFVVPKYGKVFSAYRAARSEYKSAEKAFNTAQQENTDLKQKLEELQTMQKESEDLSAEVFTLASQLEQQINDGTSNKKICYITLDDGPYNRGKRFLELFKKYDIKATFFLTTANGNKLPDQADLTATSMYPEYLKDGHTIGNHTYSHNYSDGGIYSSTKSFMNSVNKQQKFTQDATGGYTPAIVRFPGGSSMAGSNYDSITKALNKEGLGWIDWTVDSGDSWGKEKATPELIKKNIKEAAKKQKIMVILCHEWSQASLDAMPEIIEYLDEQGYIFLPLFPESIMVQK